MCDTMELEREAKRNKLNHQEEELKEHEAQNENKILKLENLRNEQLQNEKEKEEKRRVDEKVLKLAEELRKEKESLQKWTVELEKKLDAKQTLELEIKRLMGESQVVKHMRDDEDDSVPEKLRAIGQDLKDMEEELEYLDALNQIFIVNERRCNDELQEARKELIDIFSGYTSHTHIVVKRMGELDSKAFIPAAKRKCLGDHVQETAIKLCSQWESYIRDANWHPFKVVSVDGGNTYKTVVNKEDQKLKTLKGLGEEAYKAVISAMMEMNEYNPSGRYIVPELWNKTGQRRATLKEGISVLRNQWSKLKRKKGSQF